MTGLELSFQPFISWPVLWMACAVGAVLAAVLVYLRRRGWPLRLAALALLLAALFNPQLNSDERQPLNNILAVVVDDSASQSLGDRRAQTEKALADVEQKARALGNVEVRVAHTVTGNTPDTDGTRVFSALSRLAESIPPERYAGAVLITDGQIHDVPDKLSGTMASGPVHTLLTGSRKEKDRRVVIDQAPRFAITGKDQLVKFHIEDMPQSAGTATVTVRLPDGSTEQIDVPVNAEQSFSVPIQHAGQNLIEIEAAPVEGEITRDNNRALVNIKGIRDRLRVLLVSGEPHPGERTWRNLLKSDAAVDLVHFTILRPPEKQDGTLTRELSLIAFPTRELFIDKISSFDLVIFDRYRMQSILPEIYLANVADYVRNGGAVLISSGPDLASPDGLYSTPLADIMTAAPTGMVTEHAFRPAMTDDGNRHPVTQNLPGAGTADTATWGRWFRLINAKAAPDTNTLLKGPEGEPLLVLGHVGEGRVAQFLSDQGWLWARGFDGGGPQMELLRRLAHWLMKEPDLDEEALSARQDGQKIVIERRTMRDAAEPVKLKGPDGKEQDVALQQTTPGFFTARLPFTEAGLYTVADGKLNAVAAIGTIDQKETSDARATATRIEGIAKQSHGGIYWIEDGLPRVSEAAAGQLMAGSNWLALKDNGQYRVTAISGIPLFATLLSLAVLLFSVIGMWFREGR